MSGRVSHLLNMGTRRRGERLIQIFPEWPARYGTVLEVGSGARRTAVLVEWDDGRQDWIHTADFRRRRILFVSDDKRAFEPKAGPLETLLSRYMGGDGGAKGPRFPKGGS
jgi:hypothetical protein